MAASFIANPGAKYGPCKNRRCGHRDCEFSREQADCHCTICKTLIGYNRRFYVVGSIEELAHATCLEDQVERERKILGQHQGQR